MVLVDSSVWIEYFRNSQTLQVNKLEELIDKARVVTGDLIVAEVLQGCDSRRDFDHVLSVFDTIWTIPIAGRDIAIQAARNYRILRGLGITVRKTIDCLIATRCIVDGLTLLHADRDFEPFVTHLGLRDAMIST